MRCFICNKVLDADEIKIRDNGEYDPCSECIGAADELNVVPLPEDSNEHLPSTNNEEQILQEYADVTVIHDSETTEDNYGIL